MRLLYSFPHSLDRPGIALTARQQVLGLARLGVQVELFATSIGALELPPGVTVHTTLSVGALRVPHRALGVQRAYDYHDAVVSHWLSRHGSDIDIVHAWPRGCLRTLTTARSLGIPALRESPNPHTASVIRQSELAAADAGIELPATHSHASNRDVLAREREEYAAASAVLVPSDYARDEFLAEGFPARSLLQHRYGCDLDRFPARTAVRGQRPFRAVFVGRGDPTKGLHVALEAWLIANLPNAEFLIAGALQPDYAAALADLLALPTVTTLGFVTDVSALLRSADVMLLPTWTEGSALVTLEAEASGCVPLVSTAAGALGDDGIDYLEHPVGDRAALAAQLVLMAGDAEGLARLSTHGTARRDFLSWDRAGEVLLERYSDAVGLTV
ncbi:Glycosyl transferase group 1 [Cryobacterium arcticum]|uniref:D-inositol 3-phosphate glycosyltransferase n=1 Tax=Cryobacterium arcticum TaxID=670052 RepID=A0A1B1BNZ9_9MICO|nr:Glycosyl transferase group 1 [Cryobacterium arcticum]